MLQSSLESYHAQSNKVRVFKNKVRLTRSTEKYQKFQDWPTEAEEFLKIGILYWRRGDYDRSEQLITKAKELSSAMLDTSFLAQCLIGLALVKTSLGKDDDAISIYKQAIKLTPENFHLWNNLAGLYVKKEHFEPALHAFECAIRINPRNAIAWNGLANIYYRNEIIDEAINAYKRTIALLPEINNDQPNFGTRNPEVKKLFILPWLRLAALHVKKSQYLEALDMYKKALLLDEENAEIWNEIGTLYIKMEAYEEALKPLSKAVELNSEYGAAYLNQAFAYTQLDRFQDSIPLFIKSIETLPDRRERELVSNMMELAKQNLKQGKVIKTPEMENEMKFISSSEDVTWFYFKYSEEITSKNFSCSLYNQEQSVANKDSNLPKPHDSDLMITMVSSQVNKGAGNMLDQLPSSLTKYAYMKADLMRDKAQDKTVEIIDPVAWIEKGNIYFKSQEYREAGIAYNKAIEVDPSFGQPYHNLALIHFVQGNYEDAIMLYQESLKFLMTNYEKAIAWNNLGNVFRCIKDYKNARLAYQRASELDKNNGGAFNQTVIFNISKEQRTAGFWIDLGKLLFKTGAYDKAALAFEKAIKLDPSLGHAYSHFARVLTAQGQYREAISFYRKSIDLIKNEKEKANAWNRLGDVYRKLNDYDNALKAYQNALALTNEKWSLLNRARFSLLSNCTAK